MKSEKEPKEESHDEEKEYSGVDEKVMVPEALQHEAVSLVNSCKNRQCVSFIQSLCSRKVDEFYEMERKERESKKGGEKNKVPSEYSTIGGPSY